MSGATSTAGAGTGPQAGGLGTTSLLVRIFGAPFKTTHAGTRRVEANYDVNGVPSGLVYKETVVTDGQGGFSIQPLQVIQGNVPDTPLFLLIQQMREGFLFRYRDFLIRDMPLFRQNYRSQVLNNQALIAGRPCVEYLVTKIIGSNRSYTVTVDQATALVLKYEERDGQGNLLSLMEYESFDTQPNFTGITLHQPINQEVTLDIGNDLKGQVGFAPLLPRVLPSGFELRDAANVTDQNGKTWLKLTYLDGVEPVFFMHTAPGTALASMVGQRPGGLIGNAPSDQVVVYNIGPTTVVQGKVGVYDVIAVGKVTDDELLGLIDSSLP